MQTVGKRGQVRKTNHDSRRNTSDVLGIHRQRTESCRNFLAGLAVSLFGILGVLNKTYLKNALWKKGYGRG
jgi:hypothetical protein